MIIKFCKIKCKRKWNVFTIFESSFSRKILRVRKLILRPWTLLMVNGHNSNILDNFVLTEALFFARAYRRFTPRNLTAKRVRDTWALPLKKKLHFRKMYHVRYASSTFNIAKTVSDIPVAEKDATRMRAQAHIFIYVGLRFRPVSTT